MTKRISQLPAATDPLDPGDMLEGERVAGLSERWTVEQIRDAGADGLLVVDSGTRSLANAGYTEIPWSGPVSRAPAGPSWINGIDIVPPVPGWYFVAVNANMQILAAATSIQTLILVNGTSVFATDAAFNPGATDVNAVGPVYVDGIADAISVSQYHNSGSAVTGKFRASVHWVAP